MAKKKQITGKQLGSTYKRSKKKYKDATAALQDVLKRNKFQRQKNLIASENETHFIFSAKTKLD